MVTYEWTNVLETGHALIDEQHKELIKRINTLLENCYQGLGIEKLQETLRFVNDYTITHFHDEEQLQLRYKYPAYEEHKKLHDWYKKTIRDLMVELIQKGLSPELSEKVKSSVGDWIVQHIKTEDVKLAAYIRAQD
jgi:hemerythrin